MSQQFQQVGLICQANVEGGTIQPIVDPIEQKRLELQAQIEALQTEMASM